MAIIDCKVKKPFVYKGIEYQEEDIFPFDSEKPRDIGLKRAGFIEEFPVEFYDYTPRISLEISKDLIFEPKNPIKDIQIFENINDSEPYRILNKLVLRGKILKTLKDKYRKELSLSDKIHKDLTEIELAKFNNIKTHGEFEVISHWFGYNSKGKNELVDIKICKDFTKFVEKLNKEGA